MVATMEKARTGKWDKALKKDLWDWELTSSSVFCFVIIFPG
jgi:hypothetical protein